MEINIKKVKIQTVIIMCVILYLILGFYIAWLMRGNIENSGIFEKRENNDSLKILSNPISSVGVSTGGDNQFRIGTLKQITPSLQIGYLGNATMIIYANGSFWIKNGTEQYDGEQLAKVALSFSSYKKGWCDAQ